MRKILVILTVLACVAAQAQKFGPLHDVPLANTITSAVIEVADFDNDGLLDVAIIANDNTNKFIQFIKGDTLNTPALTGGSVMLDNYTSYTMVDYDDDNDMDFVFYGSSSAVYSNDGNFSFSKQAVALPAFTKKLWVDLNSDGKKEIVGNFSSGSDKLIKIFRRTGSNSWETIGNDFKLDVTSFELVDTDFNGNPDVFVSGRFAVDSVYSGVLINEGGFVLTPTLGQEWNGVTAAGDLNEDGVFDLAFIGNDGQSNPVNRLWVSSGQGFNVNTNLLPLTAATVFVADFNSDGKTDISHLGKNGVDTLNLIRTAFNDYDTISVRNLVSQRFADVDRDGDLDVVQLTKPDFIHITFIENYADENNGPSTASPSSAIGVPVYNRYFIYWRPFADDHTVTESLTYDVVLDEIQSAEFDLTNPYSFRLRTSHGNNLTQNFKLFGRLPAVPSGFIIQGVDNSYATYSEQGGTCMGSTNFTCADVEEEIIQVCKGEEIVLSAPPGSLWFSFNSGFLGSDSTKTFKPQAADTVFYFDAASLSCASLKTFRFEINNVPKVQNFKMYTCEQQTLQLSAELDWETIQWSSQHRGNLGTQENITYIVTGEDSVFVRLTNPEGCDLIRKTAIRISKPEVRVDKEQIVIMKGESVQLSASGADRYTWSPAINLSSTTLANPVASPTINTTYVVTGYDSLNCTAQASVLIFVEETGFVPNLFTPNDDGKNDELKIYGLRSTSSIDFSIYNREGKLVYQTTDATEATQRGWDGTKGGMKQPAGVYFWKVKGTMSSGGRVLLNGKKEGSIVLVR